MNSDSALQETRPYSHTQKRLRYFQQKENDSPVDCTSARIARLMSGLWSAEVITVLRGRVIDCLRHPPDVGLVDASRPAAAGGCR